MAASFKFSLRSTGIIATARFFSSPFIQNSKVLNTRFGS
ncbi:Uncharacterised protein [Vibrio cholerae]|nr:Uncharacterised protein [Vibrio cholerae]